MPVKYKQNGIGLLELMLSLAIIAILLVTATSYYVTTRLNEQIDEAAEMVVAVYSAGQSWLQSHDDFSTASIANFVADGSLPSNFASKTGSANPWGGDITVTGQKSSAVLGVTMTAIPQTACLNLLGKITAKISHATGGCGAPGQNANTLTVTMDMGS